MASPGPSGNKLSEMLRAGSQPGSAQQYHDEMQSQQQRMTAVMAAAAVSAGKGCAEPLLSFSVPSFDDRDPPWRWSIDRSIGRDPPVVQGRRYCLLSRGRGREGGISLSRSNERTNEILAFDSFQLLLPITVWFIIMFFRGQDFSYLL